MPSLGADMDRGTVTRWLVKPGDEVHRGDIVAIIETDKADVEVEIFRDGTIEELLVPEGATVVVGTPLALLARAARAATEARPKADERAVARRDADRPAHATGRQRGEPTSPPPDGERGLVSPRARRLAAEHGIDPAELTGTGPMGAVTGRDVERGTAGQDGTHAAPDAAASHRTVRGEVIRGTHRPEAHSGDRAAAMRAAIARAMARSKREIPHYYLAADVDFSAARAFLDVRNEGRPAVERVLPAALLIKATALAVREVPELNGYWAVDEFRPSEAVHAGVAISLRGGGLVAPAVHDADTLTLGELMTALRDLVGRARAGSLRSSEMSDATITVTNLGDHGVQAVQGVIYPPQVALVGFGAVTERPWAAAGMLGVRPVVTATLAADHRASDGARGARFLELVDRQLQHPEEL